MNECPECGGLLIVDDDPDSYQIEFSYTYYCPGCGWCSEDIDEIDDDPIDFENEEEWDLDPQEDQ